MLWMQDLSVALSHFDKRAIELLATRAEKNHPPSHLRDLGIVGLMETHGRERRHRYYTLASYRSLVAQENLQGSDEYANIDLENIGGFAHFDLCVFYEDDATLHAYQDTFKVREKGTSLPKGTAKRGRPRKNPSTTNVASGVVIDESEKNVDEKAHDSDVPSDRPSKPKNSHPRKKQRVDAGEVEIPVKDSLQQIEPQDQSIPVAKKRGRPRKVKPVSLVAEAGPSTHPQTSLGGIANEGSVPGDSSTRKRGRPRHQSPVIGDSRDLLVEPVVSATVKHAAERPPPKKRQRIGLSLEDGDSLQHGSQIANEQNHTLITDPLGSSSTVHSQDGGVSSPGHPKVVEVDVGGEPCNPIGPSKLSQVTRQLLPPEVSQSKTLGSPISPTALNSNVESSIPIDPSLMAESDIAELNVSEFHYYRALFWR